MAEGTVTIRGRAELGEINRAVGKLERQVDKVDKTSKRAKVSIQDAGRALTAFGATAAIGGAALGALVDDTLKARLEIANLANTVGVTAPTFGALAKAAELAGKSSDQLVGGLAALGAAAFDAAQGNAEAAKKFSDLGVSVTDAGGELRDTEAIFRDVLAALGEMPNEAERTARAQKLMGESAGALKAALGELSIEGFEAAQLKAAAFTRGLSEEGLRAAQNYEAALVKVDAIVQSVGDSVSGLAGPALNFLTDSLTYASVFAAEAFNKAFERIGERLFLLIETVKELGPIIGRALTGDLAGAAAMYQKADQRIVALAETLGVGTGAFSDFSDVLEAAKTKAEEAVEGLQRVHDATRETGKQSEGTKRKIEEQTEATEEAAIAAITFADSLGLIIDHGSGTVEALSLSEDAALQYRLELERLAEDADRARAAQAELNAVMGETPLEQFAYGFGAVTQVIGSLSGAFVNAAQQSDNLTESQKRAALAAFRVQQAAALATAVVNTALGITQALASAPPPLSFVNAGLVGAAGAVSIAEIASQKPPSFALGGIMPSTGGPAILHPGEGVLSAGAVDSMGGASALDALNSRSAMGAGGAVVVQWKHLRQSFAYEARDGYSRPGPLRDIRRDGRRAGQLRRTVRADYGSL
jgi:hypothetical protein